LSYRPNLKQSFILSSTQNNKGYVTFYELKEVIEIVIDLQLMPDKNVPGFEDTVGHFKRSAHYIEQC